jgi:hypothetical protein
VAWSSVFTHLHILAPEVLIGFDEVLVLDLHAKNFYANSVLDKYVLYKP